VIGKGLAEPDHTALGPRQQRLKPRAALNEWLLAKIAPGELQQIEAIDAGRHMPPVQQSKEVRLSVTASRNQLAIDDAGLRGEAEHGRGDRWESAREVSAIPTIDRREKASFVKLYPVAVKFQLVYPAFAGRR
jgi:hypothetical protein